MANSVAPPQCVLDIYLEAITTFCDGTDGVIDGLVSEPSLCNFNTGSLIGQTVKCSSPDADVGITGDHAAVIAKTLQGATSTSGEFLWYGLAPGAPFTGLADTVYANGSVTPVPLSSAQFWIGYFVDQDPDAQTANLTYKEFDTAFYRSVALFTGILGTDNPDLTSFKNRGGKLLTFHIGEQLAIGIVCRAQWVVLQQSTTSIVLFLAPGVGHCGGGTGPNSANPWAALTDWAEHGVVPHTLYANTTTCPGTSVHIQRSCNTRGLAM